jgi:hypothetical protein
MAAMVKDIKNTQYQHFTLTDKPITMNFFERIFGTESVENKSTVLISEEIAEARPPLMNEELFVDLTPPMEGPVIHQGNVNCSSRLKELVEHNRFTEGYDSGFLYHNLDIRNSEILSIKSEIKSVIRRRVSELRASLANLDTQIALIGEELLMESSKRGLQATRRQVEQNIVSLEEEYLLAEDNLGMVQYAVQTYLDGFNRGYQTYLQEQILNDKFSI